jgi:hypothetical protein
MGRVDDSMQATRAAVTRVSSKSGKRLLGPRNQEVHCSPEAVTRNDIKAVG